MLFSLFFFRLKIFVPIALLAWSILVPVNWTSHGLQLAKLRNVTSSDIDKLSISNIENGSDRFANYPKKSHIDDSFFPL
jgi:hypothetical protein